MTVSSHLPLADGWGMHGDGIGAGWWILMVAFMLVFMGAMMWMMMRGMRAGASSDSSTPPDRPGTRETPVETLERRFAEGELTIEDYRERREALMSAAAGPRGGHAEGHAVEQTGREGGAS